MIRLRISVEEWQVLSPLIDQALDLSVTERARWLSGQSALAAELREKLKALLRERDAPETGQFMETLGSARALAAARDATASTLRAGDLVGPYTLLRVVGHGGMGEVWLARRSDGAFQREVALKLPTTDHAPQRMRERLERERDVLASLEQSNIARFYDAGVSAEGQPFIAMEYVDGDTFTAYATARKLDVAARCRLMLQVLGAVQYAHQRLIVHRDLKPSNTLVRGNGQVALLDFGIAKVLDEATGEGTESQLTRETGRALTLAYAAPEQVLALPVTTATDVFACGVLFYELLSGARPFAAHEASLGTMIGAHDAPLKRMHGFKRGAMSRDLNAIVARALRREPNERYVSAAAFSDDIKRFLDDEPVVAVQGARWYAFTKFVKRQRVPLLVAATGTAALTVLGIHAVQQQNLMQRARAQSSSVERLVDGLLAGMSPDNAANQRFTAKELLDRSIGALDNLPIQPRVALKFADVYHSLGDYDEAVKIIDRALPIALADGDIEATLRLYTSKGFSSLGGGHVSAARASAVTARGWASASVGEAALAALSVLDGQIAFFGNDLSAADAAFADARLRLERLGSNADDYLTFSISQQSLLAHHRGQLVRALALLREADVARARYGEKADSLRLSRLQAEGALHIALADPARAVACLSTVYRDAVDRYGEANTSRIVAGISLASAHVEAGDTTSAMRVFRVVGRFAVGSPRADIRRDATVLAVTLEDDSSCCQSSEALVALYRESGNPSSADRLSRADRAGIARRLAETMLRRGLDDDADRWLQEAESALHSEGDAQKLLLASVRATRGVALLRQHNFVAGRRQLTLARLVYSDMLGTQNPRTLAVDFYLALAREALGESFVSPDLSSAQILAAMQSTYSAPRRLLPLASWTAHARTDASWVVLPAFFP